jgi:hypothetical protein
VLIQNTSHFCFLAHWIVEQCGALVWFIILPKILHLLDYYLLLCKYSSYCQKNFQKLCMKNSNAKWKSNGTVFNTCSLLLVFYAYIYRQLLFRCCTWRTFISLLISAVTCICSTWHNTFFPILHIYTFVAIHSFLWLRIMQLDLNVYNCWLNGY